MSTEKTLESAYFHINNGGISFSIIERIDVRKDCTILPPDWHAGLKSGKYKSAMEDEPTKLPTETRYNRTWRFRVSSSHFGSGLKLDFPLVPLMVRWTLEALQRTLERMEAPQRKPTDGVEYAFRDMTYCSVKARDGQQVDGHWPFKPEPQSACLTDSSD